MQTKGLTCYLNDKHLASSTVRLCNEARIRMRNRRWKSKFDSHSFRAQSVVVLYGNQLTSKMQIQQFITDLHGDDLKFLLSC